MRFLFVGCCLAYRRGFYNDAGSPMARDQDVPKALAERGHQVFILGAAGSDPVLDGPVGVVRAADARVAEYDAVVLVPEYGYWAVKEKTDQGEALRRHPNVLVWCDQWFGRDQDDVDFARVYLASSPRALAVYQRRYPDRVFALLPWAMTDAPPYPNPWSTPGVRAVYCGFYSRREVPLLNAVAESGVELWFGGACDFDGVTRGLTDTERGQMFSPSVRFMTDLEGVRRTWPSGLHGPVRYGSQFPFYQHAQVALCFAREPSRRGCVTSKVYDYLGAGLPVVVEQHTQNLGDVLNLDAGSMFSYGDAAAMVERVKAEARRTADTDDSTGDVVLRRDRIRREARALGTWADRARVLEAYARVGA